MPISRVERQESTRPCQYCRITKIGNGDPVSQVVTTPYSPCSNSREYRRPREAFENTTLNKRSHAVTSFGTTALWVAKKKQLVLVHLVFCR